MQSGGGSHGRKPTDPPSSSSSPSSSAVSNQLGFESQQQQQLNLRNQQQQQLRRKHEGEENLLPNKGGGGLRGVIAGGNFPSSLSVPANQPLRMFGNLPQQHGALVDDENQNKGQNPENQNQNQNQNQKQNPNPNPNPKPNPNPNPNPNPIHQAYLQFAMQAAQQQKTHGNLIMQHPGKFGMVGPLGRDQDARGNNLQAASQQQQAAMFQKSSEQEQGGRAKMYQRADLKPPQNMNMIRPMQSVQAQPNMENVANNQLMAQFYAWAMEHNIDLSLPANANLIAQLLPMWQSAKMAAMQKANEWGSTSHQVSLPSSKSQVMPSSVGSETSIHRNSVSDQVNGPKNPPFGMISSNGATTNPVRVNNIQMQQQLAIQNRESQIERVNRSSIAMGDGGGSVMHPSQASESSSQNTDHSGTMNKSAVGADTLQTQFGRQLQQSNRPLPQPAIPPAAIVVSQMPSQGGPSQAPQGLGFTKQQLFVLKAQILAFRRIKVMKCGEGALPPEVLEAIVPPPLELEPQQVFLSQAMGNHESSEGKVLEENVKHVNANNIPPQLSQLSSAGKGHGLMKAESTAGEERTAVVNHLQGSAISTKEHLPAPSVRKAEQSISISVKAEQETERDGQLIPAKGDYNADKGKAIPVSSAPIDAGLITKSVPNNNVAVPNNSAPALKDAPMRKYHGPLFDFLCFTRKAEPFGSAANSSSCLTLAYDVKDFLFEEGKEVLTKKRTENLKKISGLLAINLERKRIGPDLVTRLQIEEKKLRLLHFQARLREEVDQEQQEIMAMPDRPYRKFVRQCERQRIELSRQVQQLQKCAREKQLKSIFLWRKKLLESHWAIRDARTTRNRGVAKIHERMLKEFAKRKDDDRNKRMEALKNNDVDRYREILLEQQTNVPGDAAQRYAVLSSFLSQTEEYLHKLGGKITAAKNHQEVEEAANAAATSAISQGLSEEEVKAAAICAGEEVMIRYQFSEMNAPRDNASDNKYYNLAHAVSERVTRQSSMLRAGTLRDYQIVGLQWMLSLYNNKLNGILADEMGLGKTVQVMALIAYLMEFKGNYGPHLIIVPNAVLVNWKSELHNWLPNLACIFYVGSKEQRSKLFSHEVCALKFNVLVTTYEFVMFDRSKLSKIDWKYIIIDEAQRMKDRESVLARDLDRYRCQRRLLLTGTPLQNNLKELWSLLNLLLPEVFDNKKAFNDWFSKPFQKDAPSHSEEEDDWLETEKKVIIIHRLHQILEPFMLRRRVEDVEGSLPPKVPIVLKCRMSAIQGAIYDWVKSTGTIRVDPEDELRRSQKNPMYQTKSYKNLNNKCMELRKACNHPLLNYPYFNDYSMDFLVRSCGKLWILDRILIKLQRAGHRVLLFSTMTKLLDILEEYLQWRRLVYRRIDGTTSLEDRESAIVNFNCPDSDCFIFLLSIRAAGRGLNLQTADTVVIYDPDPNPQNEEQAVARAHRIGQTREVKVIYMEAVVDKFSSYQKEDELRSGGTGELEDDLARTDRYMGSIESLIRNNIQQYKIDMADEVINAGRFDQRTTHEERRMTLETLLHDEERYQETLHDVPSLEEVNRMISRSEEEIELFNQMDEEFDWTGDMLKHNQVPKWLRAGSRELDVVVARLSKKPSKNILASSMDLEPKEILPNKSERRGRAKKSTIYREVDEDDDEDSDASSVERNASSLQEEEGELGEFDDEDLNGDVDMQRSNKKDQEEEDVLIYDGGGYEFSHVMEENKIARRFEEGGASSGSSSGTRRLQQSSTPSISSQKFGSLSALDAKPKPRSKRMSDELEEGEIAVSGDSYVDRQQSGSWSRDHDDGEEEQVLQPKIRRKRSMRIHPKSLQCGSQLPMQVDNDYDMQSRTNLELDAFSEPGSERDDLPNSSMSQKHTLPPRSPHINLQKSSRLSYLSAEEAMNHSKESQNGKVINTRGTSLAGAKMSDSMQRKCKNVISKLQRRISRDGQQIVPVLYDLWKKNESASPAASTLNPLDLLTIDQCIDNLVHNGVTDFIADFQLMLKDVVKYCKYSYEVKYEARKLHDLFFDIMKIAFPDTDFRDARNVLTFPSHGGATSTAPPKLTSGASQSKMRLTGEAEANPAGPNMPNPHGPTPPEEGRMTWAHASKLQKESRPFTCPEPLLTHPGELVICKKQRQDRRVGPVSPPSQGRILPGPLSPSSAGRAEPASSPSTSRGARVPAQQTVNPARWGPTPGGGGSSSGALSGIGEEAHWAKPVKRMRTDTSKRRPSHL